MSDENPTDSGYEIGYGKPPKHTQWKAGSSPNPGGKPVRARNKINAAFLNALIEEFDKSGKKAIKECAENDPSTFVRVCASLLPKEIEISRPLDDIPDEQLDAAILAVRTILAAQNPDNGTNGSGETQSVEVLQAIPEAG